MYISSEARKNLFKPSWSPHPYQQRALDLLYHNANAGLFLDPGMGKTSIVAETFRRLKAEGAIDRMVVIAPFRVASVAWPGELDKWANFHDLTYVFVHGPKKQQRAQQDVDIYLFNQEFLTTRSVPLLADILSDHRCMLVVDESTGFKNPSSKRFRTLRKLLQFFDRRIILTGTPMPNGIDGLWSQIYILDEGGLLGQAFTWFRYEYMVPKYRPGVPVALWEAQPDALDRLSEKIKPLVLQLRADDYLQLPDYLFNEISVPIPRKKYEELEKELCLSLDSTTIVSPNIAANLIRLRQIANGALYTDDGYVVLHNEKLEALEDLLYSLDGKPCLLLYQFGHDLDRIRQHLEMVIPTLSGCSEAASRNLCERFVAGEIPVLAGHPASMGHGLNLQGGGAHHIIWFGVDYNLEYWQQTLQRLRRQGNTAPTVHVHTIVASNTIEQVAVSTMQDKNSNQELFLSRIREYNNYSTTEENQP